MHRLCRCIKLSATFHLINQFYTSRISVRFVKAGSESQWSTTLLAWSQLCTDVGIAWTGPTAGSGTLALAWQTISWSSSILCVNTLIRVTGVCSSRVTENRGSFLFTVQFLSYFSVPKLLIYFIWIFFLCIWGKDTLFQFSLLWRKSQIFCLQGQNC